MSERLSFFEDIRVRDQETALDILADILTETDALDAIAAALDERADETIVHDPQSGRVGDVDRGRALSALAHQLRSGR